MALLRDLSIIGCIPIYYAIVFVKSNPWRFIATVLSVCLFFVSLYFVQIENDRARTLQLLRMWSRMEPTERLTTKGQQVSAELRELLTSMEANR